MRKLTIVILLMLTCYANAEQLVEVALRGGVAGVGGKHEYVEAKPGANVALHAAYLWHSRKIIGVRLGAGFEVHTSSLAKSDYQDIYYVKDAMGDQMQIGYNIGSLRETYTTLSASFPIQLAFSFGKGVRLYLGPKLAIPLSTTYTTKADDASLSVYYPAYNNRIEESTVLGASRSFSMEEKGNVEHNPIQWFISAELCYDLLLKTTRNHKSYLSVGIYFDYTINKEPVADITTQSLLMLSDTREGLPLQRRLSPVWAARRGSQALVERRNPFDVGIKVAYRWAPYNPYRRNARVCHCSRDWW